jgi:hypothetical protein
VTVGVRLIVEVLDHWQDAGLTAGERWDLLVLAENANDGSRLTFGPVHAPHILQRANKSPKGWKNAITALMRKKVITTHLPGRINQFAVYHLEHLCPDPPHSGYKGHCTKPEKGVDSVETPDSEEGHLSDDPVSEEGHPADDPEGHLSDDPLGQEGHPVDAERVIQQVTPTPLVSSFKDSPLSTPSSSVAEADAVVAQTDTTEGGGGGMSPGLDKITKQCKRVDAFVATLDFRGKAPGKQQRLKLGQRIMVAFSAGWTERGLARYLDLSDEPNVRSAAALYLHRLSDDELPEAAETVSGQLPPACQSCLSTAPESAHNILMRRNYLDPIGGGPCPRCHPDRVGQSTAKLPPACNSCLDFNHGAATNVRMRTDQLSFHGGPCPRCHPSMVPGNWSWPGMDTADGGMWERAAARAAQRNGGVGARADSHPAEAYTSSSVSDLFAPRSDEFPPGLLPGDRRAYGWLQLANSLSEQEGPRSGPKPMVSNGYQPHRNPEDQSVYDEPFWPEDK